MCGCPVLRHALRSHDSAQKKDVIDASRYIIPPPGAPHLGANRINIDLIFFHKACCGRLKLVSETGHMTDG